MVKPPLSLFSHAQQPFHHMDTLHQLGPPPMAPTPPLGPPPMIPAPAIGPPTLIPTQTLGPPPMAAVHALRPPPINQVHSMGPPPMGAALPMGPPPRMAHALVHPPMDHMHVLRTPPLELPQTLGPPPVNPAHAMGPPPPLLAPMGARFTLPLGPMSSPPPPNLDPSQLPPRPHGLPPCLPPNTALVPCSIAGPPPPGPFPAQAATASEHPQDEGSPLGMEEQEAGCQGLEELCKPLYCKLCNVTLNSAQQAHAHYQNHSKKLRNFYAGSQQPTAIRTPEVLESGGHAPLSSAPGDGDSGRQAHYQGKNHAKKLRLAEAQQNASSTNDSINYSISITLSLTQPPTFHLSGSPGPYYNPRPRQRIPRDLAMCVTPSGQFYCSMCNSGAEQEAEFRLHLESKQHKAKVSEL
ncbi:hypothetical protein CRUP_006196, partial [Coryphaenoides rupestris]